MAANWDELEQWMEGQQLPKGFEMLREPDWVEQFVRRMMTKTLPEAASNMSGVKSSAIKESKTHLFVQIKLPHHAVYEDIRLKAREDRVFVEGLPGGKRKAVKLPTLVSPRYCQASIKGGILKIKLRKRGTNRRTIEHTIDW
ncbi:Hsp20/alpha crystallin family protein [Paenibacillus sp. HB172176]|uniref:Hsp20/alpha crystallin family protein n=1 Tax=Paenibacillus sp. HB172176 TaxID=2493690 RepID=UPI001438EB23|nr:Hsp20/alpha crystallin family protein [Paenibacillus sp. HB172176]